MKHLGIDISLPASNLQNTTARCAQKSLGQCLCSRNNLTFVNWLYVSPHTLICSFDVLSNNIHLSLTSVQLIVPDNSEGSI